MQRPRRVPRRPAADPHPQGQQNLTARVKGPPPPGGGRVWPPDLSVASRHGPSDPIPRPCSGTGMDNPRTIKTPDKPGPHGPKPPTLRQLRYLRQLAAQAGQSFAYPRTAREASKAIDELRKTTREANRPRPRHRPPQRPDRAQAHRPRPPERRRRHRLPRHRAPSSPTTSNRPGSTATAPRGRGGSRRMRLRDPRGPRGEAGHRRAWRPRGWCDEVDGCGSDWSTAARARSRW